MIQMINKLKKNQKGFTLVELIVVLVILAILAAFTIPAMLGFVDDARAKAAVAQGREAHVAAQSATTSAATVDTNIDKGDTPATTAIINDTGKAAIKAQMKTFLNGDLTIDDDTLPRANIVPSGTVVATSEVANKVNEPGEIYLVLGKGDKEAKVLQTIYLDKNGKYVCSIVDSASGTSAEFVKK